MERLILFDTTLRDGEQSPGATMNLREKLRLARQLETLGVDVVEAGFPSASQEDFESVVAIAGALRHCRVAAFARAVEADIRRAAEALKSAVRPRLHVCLPGSDLHMREKLHMSPSEVLDLTRSSVALACSLCGDVEFSVEDASRADPDFLMGMLSVALDAGASTINVADTVGYAQPSEFAALIARVLREVRGVAGRTVGIHCHNDLGLAVANTLGAIRAGARQAEVTLGGLGERAGNAALEELVMALEVRRDVYGLSTNVRTEQIFPSCRLLSMILGRPIPATKPVVGENVFRHESGIHQDGVLKNPATYEIMTPQSIGRTETDLVIGKHSGRSAIRAHLERMGHVLFEDQIDAVFVAVKRLADHKAVIHDEDLEALVFSEVYRLPERYRLVTLAVQSAAGPMPATAAVVIDVMGKDGGCDRVKHTGFGKGPVDAICNVVAEALHRRPALEQFAINAITGGTDALGEVTVRLRENGLMAVGRASDPDVLNASAKAFIDALNRFVQKEEERRT